MWIIVLGFIVGILLGVLSPFTLPIAYARYLSIAVLAALDTAFGGLRASLEGTYDNGIFITGFFTNALLAAGLVYLGDRIGVESLYMAGVVAMGIRLFQNLGIIRRLLLRRWGLLNGAEPQEGAEEPKQAQEE
ncbi:small basic protein [Symbiobacterium terraclitae]|jgi:small basic protein|uniref:Small basic protein n=1 Tax=Symbiobacterium terraclitae TaxID=557451 RepID=A0ABS4JRS1_9FIRM|nr:small basic family protein [Symbiobacterium terraclitae]MBP2017149.1 small basic protein [Symbiobacterium terraclitae]